MPEPKPWLHLPPSPRRPRRHRRGEGRDFSVNSNPFGPPPELLEHLRELALASYPDPSYKEARAAAAAHHGAPLERVTLGSAAELIYRLAACYLRPNDAVLVATPTFGEYARASQLQGARVATCAVYRRGAPPTRRPSRAPWRVFAPRSCGSATRTTPRGTPGRRGRCTSSPSAARRGGRCWCSTRPTSS